MTDWLRYAVDEVAANYGDIVSVVDKRKQLRKFGRTTNADNNTKTTVMTLPDSAVNETMLTTNGIDYLMTDTGDGTASFTLEGHYYDTGDAGASELRFGTWTVTPTSAAPFLLPKTISRATRLYVKDGTFASPSKEISSAVYGRQEKGKFAFGSFRVIGEGDKDPEWDDLVKNCGRMAQLKALTNPDFADKDTAELMEYFEAETVRRAA